MADIRNSLTARDSHIWTLRIANVLLVALLAVAMAVIYYLNTQIEVQVPPDISKGAVLKHGELQKPNVYNFALTVWKDLNSWPTSGKKDYGGKAEKYTCQITPEFMSEIAKHIEKKHKKGELDRARELYDELAYKREFVTDLGNNTFSVALLMHLVERVNYTPVKDVYMQYSIRVVPDSRACNEFGMALDGFANDPYRTEITEEEK